MSEAHSLREVVAVRAVRAVNLLSRLSVGGSGTVIGGRVGLALAPRLLSSLASDRAVVLVSGTNGKTTTTAMIVNGWGGEVATNSTGSNMPEGHVAALAACSSSRAVLEVDEGWLARVVRATSPRIVVLLNLSRDQLDRANEVRQIAERWRTLFSEVDHGTVVANANDPLVVYAAEPARDVAWCDVPTPWNTDAVSCPKCTLPLHFSGANWWSECGFAKPAVITTALDDHLVIRNSTLALNLSLPGAFNEANAAMALTTLSLLDAEMPSALNRVNALSSVAGRFSVREWRGHRVRLLLAKNPAGFSAMLDTLPHDDSDVWVSINARTADGRDPSWLYDVPFERLRGHRVYCYGDRRLDLATRLEYAGVDAEIVRDEALVPVTNEITNVLANYTAFQEWREKSSAC
ncbi:MAG: MurT ligase domain-containing protein [Acidimicrobiales bacterium]